MLKFPSPGLARVTGLWYQPHGAGQPPTSAFSIPLGFLCAGISFFPSGGTVIGFIVFVLREGINQKGPGESQNSEELHCKAMCMGKCVCMRGCFFVFF